MITSTSNSQVKEIAALQAKAKLRQESGIFVAEGPKMVSEVPPELLVKSYFAAGSDERVLSLAQKTGAEEVSEAVFKKMSATQTPQGILALVRRPQWAMGDLISRGQLSAACHSRDLAVSGGGTGSVRGCGAVIVLEDLQDPGNLGTIVRTGEGAGIAGIIASRGTVDLTNPKTVRGTMGSIFRVPFVVADDLPAALYELKANGFTLFAAALSGSVPYDEPDYTRPSAFLIGNEGNGLSREAIDAADQAIRIPMCGSVESLNAAVSACILMYEAQRQMRQNPCPN